MKTMTIFLCTFIVLCNVGPVKSVLVSSTLEGEEKQQVRVRFPGKNIPIKKGEYISDEFYPDGKNRNRAQPSIPDFINNILDNPFGNVRSIELYFNNIDSEGNLTCVSSCLGYINNTLNEIYGDLKRSAKTTQLRNSKYHHQRWWYDNVKRSKRLLFLSC